MSDPVATAPPAGADRPQQPEGQDRPDQQEAAPKAAPPEPPQNAWDAAQELLDHAPGIFTGRANIFSGGSPSFGGHLVSGDQRLVSGGAVRGDVVGGHKTVYNIGMGFGGPSHESGEIPLEELSVLAGVFQPGPAFEAALRELRYSRVLVLKGSHNSGRRAAGLMLLHRAGAGRIRALNPDVPPSGLLRDAEPSGGYLLCDFATARSKPLLEHHLLRVREELVKQDGYLVITMAQSAGVRDLPAVQWTAPAPEAVLAAHLTARLRGTASEAGQAGLLQLTTVVDFLATARPVREVAGFAAELANFALGRTDRSVLVGYGAAAVREQIAKWFDNPEVGLRDKAFLISLAVFDQAPYALTAELSDRLHQKLHTIETALPRVGVPPFGPSIESRLQMARAQEYQENEQTPWGPVQQRMAAFTDRDTAHTLLCETWSSHPSARPALVSWIDELAVDRRPLVRTRAASTAALLASVDLPSVVSRLLGPWSESQDLRLCLQAANTLTLAYVAGTAAVPRILQDWCEDDLPQRRWTAIRAYALLGPLMPEETLRALAELGRRTDPQDFTEPAKPARPSLAPDRQKPDEQQSEHIQQDRPQMVGQHQTVNEGGALVEAIELLLLSTAGDSALARLDVWLGDDTPLRQLALSAFLAAARRTEGGPQDPLSWPLLLRRYAPGQATTPDSTTPVPYLAESDGSDADAVFTALVTALWRAALAERTHSPAALDILQIWINAAADGEIADRLCVLLAALAVTDRERLRLDHLLRTAHGPHHPPQFFGRLQSAVTGR